MKSLIKLVFIPVLMLLLVTPIIAQTNTGSLQLNIEDCNFDEDGYWYNSYVLNVSPNTPIKINYTLNTYDGFYIYTYENGSYKYFVSAGEPTNGTSTIISTTGIIYVCCYYGDNGMDNDPIFSLNYSIDPNYTISTNPTIIQNDEYISGKLGIGIQPSEKLHINGAIRGNQPGGALRVKTDYGSLDLGAQNGSWAHIYSDLPKFIFNKPIYSITGEFSSYASNNLILETNGNARMTILSNGNAGIGVTNPQGILQVRGTYDNSWIYFSSNAGMNSTKYNPKVGNGLAFTWNYSGGQEESIINYSGSSVARLDFTSWDGTNLTTEMTLKKGSLGIGTKTPSSKLDVVGDAKISSTLNVTGHVGIGTASTSETIGAMLTVKGKIHAEEVIVDLAVPADYVFKSSYKLMPLYQVEQYVTANSHLPEIPSAGEITKNGMNMGEMQNKLLQKIEELTLYVIEQQKQIDELKKQLEK